MSTNLPITTSAPQTATPAAKKTDGANATDDMQSAPLFMEVLAKQIKGPQLKDAKPDADLIAAAIGKNVTIVPVGELPAEDIKTEVAPADAAVPGALPNDMLAAMLLPQAAIPVASGAVAATKGDANDPSSSRLTLVAATRTDVPGKAALEAVQSAANNRSEPAAAPGQPAFAAALAESASRTAAISEQNIAAREALAIAGATQTAPSAAVQTTAANLSIASQQPVVQAAINAPVGRERWGDEFSQRITWLATPRQDQTAELHLNPPQLGPLDVVLKVSGDQATALFTSPHAAVRDAIEQALPRLREMLADNGISLGNATVSDQAPRESGSETARHKASGAGESSGDAAATAETPARVSQISRHNGIVDTFA